MPDSLGQHTGQQPPLEVLALLVTLHTKFNILYALNLVFVITVSHYFKKDILPFLS